MDPNASSYPRLFRMKKTLTVTMIGYDGSGKTSLLNSWLDKNETVLSTLGLNCEDIEHDNVQLRVRDLGGDDKLRLLWDKYYSTSDHIVYVVDAGDFERFDEVVKHIRHILDTVHTCRLTVVHNKIDLPNVISQRVVFVKHIELIALFLLQIFGFYCQVHQK